MAPSAFWRFSFLLLLTVAGACNDVEVARMPPERALGSFTLFHRIDHVSGGGFIATEAFGLGDVARQYLSGLPGAADEECRHFDAMTVLTPQFLDAGTIVASGPDGSLELSLTSSTQYFGSGPADWFVPSEEYRVISSGGPDVDAFETAVSSPEGVETIVPVTLGRAEDLVLTWSSTGQSQPLILRIDRYPNTLLCRFEDDGSGIVPASELAAFPSDEDLGILFGKVTWRTFDVDPGSAPVLVWFVSGDASDLVIE